MVWKAIDQFVYTSIFICSAFMISYKRNKFISALILVTLFILSHIFILRLLVGIPLLAVTILTMGLIILDLIDDYKKGKKKTSNFYMDIFIFLIGVFILICAILPFTHLSFTEFFHSVEEISNFLSIFNYYALLLAIYLSFNEFNDMKKERQKAIDKDKEELIAIENKKETLILNLQKELPESIEATTLLLEENIDEETSSYIPAKYINEINYYKDQGNYTSRDLEHLRSVDSDKKKNLYFILFIIILSFILGIINFFSYTSLNMEKKVLLKYDTNNYISDISYYVPWENFDSNHFYNEINQEAKELSYTEEQIKDIYPDYDEELQKRIKGSKIKVSLSKTKNLKYGDEVEVNVSYDEKKANKNKIKIKKTHFTKKVLNLKHSITQEEFDTSNFDMDSVLTVVQKELEKENVSYSNIKLKNSKIEKEENKDYDISYLNIDYTLDGKKDKLFSNKEIKNINFKIEIFAKNNQVQINEENSKIEY